MFGTSGRDAVRCNNSISVLIVVQRLLSRSGFAAIVECNGRLAIPVRCGELIIYPALLHEPLRF
jgi:hypothetical protein